VYNVVVLYDCRLCLSTTASAYCASLCLTDVTAVDTYDTLRNTTTESNAAREH